jgi:hypothetical protein
VVVHSGVAAQLERKSVALWAVTDFAVALDVALDGGFLLQRLDRGYFGSCFEECDGTLEGQIGGVVVVVEVVLAAGACDSRATASCCDYAQVVAGDMTHLQVQDAPSKILFGAHSNRCYSSCLVQVVCALGPRR